MTTTKAAFFGGVVASCMATTRRDIASAIANTRDATTFELRIDSIFEVQGRERALEILDEVTGDLMKRQQAILTLKPARQGGKVDIDNIAQYSFWNSLSPRLAQYIRNEESRIFVDWDFSFAKYLDMMQKESPFPLEKIGCSLHCSDTPVNLAAYFKSLTSVPAEAFLKFVPTATNRQDCVRVKSLFDGYNDPRPLIAFAMGEAGRETRFQCLSWGSAATYGYIPGGQPSAPGQVSFNELLYDLNVAQALVEHRQ